MQRQVYQNYSRDARFGVDWSRLIERLIYLPGAMLFIYGLWLSLTT